MGRCDTGPRRAPCSGSTWCDRACSPEPPHPSTRRGHIPCEARSPHGCSASGLPDRSCRSQVMSRSGRTWGNLWTGWGQQTECESGQGAPVRNQLPLERLFTCLPRFFQRFLGLVPTVWSHELGTALELWVEHSCCCFIFSVTVRPFLQQPPQKY